MILFLTNCQTSRPSTRTPSPSSILPVLRDLGSPVPDLASTLSLHSEEDDVDEDNVSFLRTPLDYADIASSQALTRELRNERRRLQFQHRERSLSDEARERRLRERHPRQYYDTYEEWANGMRDLAGTRSVQLRTHSPYGEHAPNRQFLYDWAPASEEGDEDELESILAALRYQQPNTHPDVLRDLGQAHLEANRELRSNRSHSRSQQSGQAPSHEPSLRSAAILQSVRRNRQLSARSRDLMQRYVMDRERTGQESEDQERVASSSLRASRGPVEASRIELNRMIRQSSQRSREPIASQGQPLPQNWNPDIRQRYLEDPRPNPVKFERAIKFLSYLQTCDVELNKVPPNKWQKSRLKPATLSRLQRGFPNPPSSWLSSGLVFSGFQQAAPHTLTGTTLYRVQSNPSELVTGPSPLDSLPHSARVSQFNNTQSTVASSAHQTQQQTQASRDRWTVRVALHGIDYERMTLQGTMEAFNVPSVPPHSAQDLSAPPTKTTFSTYLEGELLDLATHPLLTHRSTSPTQCHATTSIDATYWRKLEPFACLSDEELCDRVLDPEWIERELVGKYILMRWKERCFVRETPLSAATRTRPRDAGVDAMAVNAPSRRLLRRHDHGGGRDTRGEADRAQRYDYHNLDAQPDDDDHGGEEDTDGEEETQPAASFLAGADGNGYGLSISGFYYVCLRRSDGRCEGLYHDPASSPYQRMELWPERAGRGGAKFPGSGVWEFR